MNQKLYNPSYDDLHSYCVEMATHISNIKGPQPTRIIGLSRGGLFPSIILSHLLHLSMTPVVYSSVHGKGERTNANYLPEVQDRTILIVDDISDSGHTLHEVVDYYKYIGRLPLSVALYYKEGSVHRPDFYYHTIPADAPWVIFPWEA